MLESNAQKWRATAAAATLCIALAGVGLAGVCGPPEVGSLCPTSSGPDVIVGDITGILRFGTLGDRTAYAAGTMACNLGDQPIPWEAETASHPVITQNFYRLRDDRLVQIGMSWAKHGFTAFQESCCCPTCIDTGDFDRLNPGCSDIYNASLNGSQTGFGTMAGLGPRSDINPVTGAFPFPYTTQGQSGDVLYKRIQVLHNDLDPQLNPGAVYLVEAQYITPDDAAAGHADNNASWSPFIVSLPDPEGGWTLEVTGPTTVLEPAIAAWDDYVPGVNVQTVDIPADGRLFIAHHVTDNGDGTWHYEYAVFNLNSHRAVSGIVVPADAGLDVTNPGFHDIDHHSGEPYDNTDWAFAFAGSTIEWAGDDYAVNVNANAIRWGTMYNVWFDANAAPTAGDIELRLFRPGAPASMVAPALVPGAPPPSTCPADIADNNNAVDVFDLLELLSNWGTAGNGADIEPSDAVVDVFDLLTLLSSWGACP